MNEAAEQPFNDAEIRVVYRDTDQMGVVYYANYFVFMERARTEYLRARGLTYRELEQGGINLPVTRAECDYKRPARYDDLVRVRAFVAETTRVRLVFRYEIYCDARGELLATGSTRHVYLGKDMRPRRVSKDFVRFLRKETEEMPPEGTARGDSKEK